jgi:outer membrane protein assembly factor BamA
VLVGVGLEHHNFGFRKEPFASHIRARIGYATGAGAFRADFDAEFRRENSDIYTSVRALASGIEILRFHGFGNETELLQADEFYEVEQRQLALDPRVVFPLGESVTFEVGPSLLYSDTRLPDDRFISFARPYGAGDFGQAGARAGITIDRRDRPGAATRGVLLDIGGGWFPAVWDVERPFGDVHGDVSAYVTAGGGPTLALRAGGRHVFGEYPFHEAAYIGDETTARLGRKQRFGGDAELHGSAELRQRLGRITLVLPGDIGILGFVDSGRVFYEGEPSDRWHSAFGGGLWFAVLSPDHTFSLSVARSSERTGIYAGAGFAF